MVFYVCYGRVQVDISGVQFSAGKGSVFQIPRGELTSNHIGYSPYTNPLSSGNYYSFQNSHPKNARLFFTQCCLPEGSEAPVQSGTAAGPSQSQFGNDSGPSEPPAAKARGRPKGKQKAK